MQIVELRAENVKRLTAVNIKPDGSLVIIGGDNAQGKSSVLDAIEYALGGVRHMPEEPLRRGTERGRVVVDLGNIIVLRTFTPGGGGSLVVKNAEGLTYSSPQGMLDELVGKLAFDPLAFMQRPAGEQLADLRRLTNVDLSDLDESSASVKTEREKLAARRTEIEGQLSLLEPVPEGTPDEEVSIEGLLRQRSKAAEIDAESVEVRQRLQSAKEAAPELGARAPGLLADIKEAEQTLANAKKALANLEAEIATQLETVDRLTKLEAKLPPNQTRAIDAELAKVEDVNKGVRLSQQRRKLEAERAEVHAAFNAQAAVNKNLERERRERIGAAELPVEGIGFGPKGVTWQDLPFEQASFAEQLRVSVAMGIAANPKLKVMLVRDGSALDDKNLKIMASMVEDAGYQLWLERVGDDPNAQIIIEDGHVRGDDSGNDDGSESEAATDGEGDATEVGADTGEGQAAAGGVEGEPASAGASEAEQGDRPEEPEHSEASSDGFGK